MRMRMGLFDAVRERAYTPFPRGKSIGPYFLNYFNLHSRVGQTAHLVRFTVRGRALTTDG